jgi:hypothetical protein
MLRFPNRTVLALSVALAAACGEKANQQATPDSSASSGKADLGAGRIDDAVKGLASASPGTVKGDPNQPPPNGMFAPGVADKAMAPGAPPKLEILGEGEDPKIQLHASVPKGKETLNVLLQMAFAGKPLAPLLVTLDVAPDTGGAAPPPPPAPAGSSAPDAPKPKPAPTGSAAAGAPAAPAELGPILTADQPMVATIANVMLPNVEEPPKELIDALKGTTIRFTMTKTGPMAFAHTFPKEADPQLVQTIELQIGALEDAFSALYTPAPDKPVGEGAYWMVTDRRKSLGADVIRYRVISLAGVQGDNAELSIQIKQYMVDDKSALTSLVKMENPIVVEYEAVAKAAMTIGPGSRYPKEGQMEAQVETTVMPAAAKGNPQAPRAPLSIQMLVQTGPIQIKEKPKDGKDKPKDKAKPKPQL